MNIHTAVFVSAANSGRDGHVSEKGCRQIGERMQTLSGIGKHACLSSTADAAFQTASALSENPMRIDTLAGPTCDSDRTSYLDLIRTRGNLLAVADCVACKWDEWIAHYEKEVVTSVVAACTELRTATEMLVVGHPILLMVLASGLFSERHRLLDRIVLGECDAIVVNNHGVFHHGYKFVKHYP